jgi:polyhydroxybutyrate depolymerase
MKSVALAQPMSRAVSGGGRDPPGPRREFHPAAPPRENGFTGRDRGTPREILVQPHRSTSCMKALIHAALAVACGNGAITPSTGSSGGTSSAPGGSSADSGGSSGARARGGTSAVSAGGTASGGSAAGGTSNAGTGAGLTASGGSSASATGGTSDAGTSGTGGTANGGAGGASTGGSAMGGGAGSGGGTPSSGCAVQGPPTGTSIDGTLTVGADQRTYRLSVPSDYVAGEPLPLVFVFNGVGGTGVQAQQFFQVEAGHRAIFVYPDALPNATTNGQIAWVFDANGIDVAYFDALLALLTQSYCIDTSRVFALGASSGAIMSNMLGCFRGDVLRAIAPSSGMDWSQGGCKGDVAVMVICGEQDTFNPCDDATNGAVSETNVWVPANGCTTQTAPSPISDICVDYQGCRPADPVLLCTHAGGHGWPTSNGDFYWQFFTSLD